MRAPAAIISTILALLVGPRLSQASPECSDILFTSTDLEGILDLVLGSWRSVVRERSVTIEPDAASCYVHIRMAAGLLPGVDCVLEACSVAVFKDQRIGLREFNVKGCDAIVNLLQISRHVPTAFADAGERITQHCSAPGFSITEVSPVRSNAGPRIRIKLNRSTLNSK
jgi:hypothetical protein